MLLPGVWIHSNLLPVFLFCQCPLEGGSGHSWSLASGWHVLPGRGGDLTWDAALLNPVLFKVTSRVSHKAVYHCICYQHAQGGSERAQRENVGWRADARTLRTVPSVLPSEDRKLAGSIVYLLPSPPTTCSVVRPQQEMSLWRSEILLSQRAAARRTQHLARSPT